MRRVVVELPLHVFDIERTGVMAAICGGQRFGTYIGPDVERSVHAPDRR